MTTAWTTGPPSLPVLASAANTPTAGVLRDRYREPSRVALADQERGPVRRGGAVRWESAEAGPGSRVSGAVNLRSVIVALTLERHAVGHYTCTTTGLF